jgi:hypothetical protein
MHAIHHAVLITYSQFSQIWNVSINFSKILTYIISVGLERILTMVYVVQNSQIFSGLFPSSGIPKNMTFRKLDLFPSSGEGGEEDAYSALSKGPG